MTDTIQTFPAPPPATPASVVNVSAAQVWSAAAQNIFIAGIVGLLMFNGKISEELGLLALGAISGIDLLGRIKAKASPIAALAVGATGMISKLPHLFVALALGSSLFGGCAALGVDQPKSAADVAALVRSTLDQTVRICQLPVAQQADVSKVCAQVISARRLAGTVADEDGGAE